MELNDIIEKLKKKTFQRDKIPYPKDNNEFTPTPIQNIEIGCGVGLHPIQFALNNKNEHLVAIEHTKEKFEKFYRRYTNHDSPENLVPLHENAISWITHKVPSETIDHIFLLYPNPNPKQKDWNKRWFCMPFFSEIIRVLKPSGKITLATNEKFYLEEAIYLNEHLWKLKVIENKTLDTGDAARTHFEKKYLNSAQSCYNLILKKT